jgi:hypothetical protein
VVVTVPDVRGRRARKWGAGRTRSSPTSTSAGVRMAGVEPRRTERATARSIGRDHVGAPGGPSPEDAVVVVRGDASVHVVLRPMWHARPAFAPAALRRATSACR